MTDPTTTEAAPPKSGFGWKQVIAGVVTLAVLAVIFIGIFPQFANYQKAFDSIAAMTVPWMVTLVIVTIVNVIVYVWPYQAALPGLTYGPGFVVRQTSFMISNTIPAGGAIGLGVQYSMTASYGFGPAPTTAAIGITSVWNLFVTLGLPVAALVGLIVTGDSESWAYAAAGLGIVAIGGAIVVFGLMLRRESTARRVGEIGDRIVAWAFGLFKKEYEPRLADGVVRFRSSTVDVISDRWGRITVTNVLQQLAQFAILYVAILAISDASPEVNFAEALAAFSFGRLATFIPITPGGLGTVDASITALLTSFGMSSDDAVAAVLVWRAASYFPQVFIGIATFLYWRVRSPRRAEDVAADAVQA